MRNSLVKYLVASIIGIVMGLTSAIAIITIIDYPKSSLLWLIGIFLTLIWIGGASKNGR